jgi:hypothetical protein
MVHFVDKKTLPLKTIKNLLNLFLPLVQETGTDPE